MHATQHPIPDPGPLVARGLKVFPLPPGSKAAPTGWHNTIATGDAAEVRATWPTGSNIGVSCRASKIVAIDLDRHATGINGRADGVVQFERVCARWGFPRPTSLEIHTPNDGRHLLFKVPPGLIVMSVSGGTSRLGPGIDIRGTADPHGGYIAGPGSIVDDRAYRIMVDAPIAVLPGFLAALIGHRRRTP